MRHDNRQPDQLRPLRIERGYHGAAPGRVLISAGRTTVLCTASISDDVPPWMAEEGKGWVTAEYGMLPGSTRPRKRRPSGKPDSRATEIQRLIGRSLRAVVDINRLGPRTITVDCDVLEADGGTRTLSITGAMIALVDALATLPDMAPKTEAYPVLDSLAAVSCGLVDGRPLLDLDYREDFAATVDMNVVMTGAGRFVEIQGTGEEATFSEEELTQLLALARAGIHGLIEEQRRALGEAWPF